MEEGHSNVKSKTQQCALYLYSRHSCLLRKQTFLSAERRVQQTFLSVEMKISLFCRTSQRTGMCAVQVQQTFLSAEKTDILVCWTILTWNPAKGKAGVRRQEDIPTSMLLSFFFFPKYYYLCPYY
jgi:hypothetical protein